MYTRKGMLNEFLVPPQPYIVVVDLDVTRRILDFSTPTHASVCLDGWMAVCNAPIDTTPVESDFAWTASNEMRRSLFVQLAEYAD